MQFLDESKVLSKEEIAHLLSISKEAYDAFENYYNINVLNNEEYETVFSKPSVDKSALKDEIINREAKIYANAVSLAIVEELISKTRATKIENNRVVYEDKLLDNTTNRVLTPKDIIDIPESIRPQLLGSYYIRQISQAKGSSAGALLYLYKKYKECTDLKAKKDFYQLFRQGLDILDLDPILYEMLKLDPNSIGKWICAITKANSVNNAFKIPNTIVIQVPLSLLQLSRIDYDSINDTTKNIINMYCRSVFELDLNKEYFIKTGTFSSKFDFRNAKISTPKEVSEIGEYLLFISNLASTLAGPLTIPSIYGISSNNEWTVREYIKDVENNPTIYQGLPLHTEYRIFIDCDKDEILGIFDYWDRELLKKRFSSTSSISPHDFHDYVVVEKYSEVLDSRFVANKDYVLNMVKEILPNINLKGQWSLDIMQNGTDFYIIDMAIASTSAFKERIQDKISYFEYPMLPDLSMYEGQN